MGINKNIKMKFFATAALIATVSAAACSTTGSSSTKGDTTYTVVLKDLAAKECTISTETFGYFTISAGKTDDCKNVVLAIEGTKKGDEACENGTGTKLNEDQIVIAKDKMDKCSKVVATITPTANCNTVTFVSEKGVAVATGAASFAAKSVLGASAFALGALYM